jgi:hypothetical protein
LQVAEGGRRFCEAALDVRRPLRSINVFSHHVFVWDDELRIFVPFFDALACLLRAYHARGVPLTRLQVTDYVSGFKLVDVRLGELRGLVGELVIDVRVPIFDP